MKFTNKEFQKKIKDCKSVFDYHLFVYYCKDDMTEKQLEYCKNKIKELKK